MTRAQVIAAYRKAAELARSQGVDVRFYEGWTTRGRAGLTPAIIVEHDTSDAARLTTARMLQILANGHGALAGNAITTDAIMRDGTVYVIASGLAWHAGAGVWQGQSGNARALGTEYQRATADPLTDRQLQVGRIWTRARCAAFSIPVSRVCEHAEYATPRGRKIDRSLRRGVRLAGPDWRRQLAAVTTASTPENVMTPAQERKLDQAIADAAEAKANTARILELIGERGTATLLGDAGRNRRGLRKLLEDRGLKVVDGP